MSEEEKLNGQDTVPEDIVVSDQVEDEKEDSNEEEKDTDREQLSIEEDSCNNSDDDRIFVSNEEMMNLQLFRNICFNIRENLDSIKSYKKETLLPERKAVYLSILDAAINGPYYITTDDAIAVFGVSENYVDRTRNIGLDAVGTEYASSKGAKDRSRSRQEPVHDDHQHPPGLRLRVSHQRSHQRSRSAHDGPSMGHHVERKISTFTNEIAKPLQIQFQAYSRHGDRKGSGTQLTLSQSDKWLRQAEVIDGRNVTTTDSAILWRRLSKSHIWMNFPEWLSFVEQLAEEKELDIHQVRDSLLRCGKPKTSMIEFDSSDITLRLTDYNNYPHRHRSRFDSNGNGLGVAGTRDMRDLPVLWATPSPSGFMMTCPSVMGPGRSGATSPIQPRKYGYEDICRI